METDHQVVRLGIPQGRWGRRLFKALPLLGVLSFSGASVAHPSHSSYAEIAWSQNGLNPALDVALRVIPEDLERALSLAAGKNTVLVDTPVVRELLTGYLASRIALGVVGETAINPLATELVFVGMQLDYRDTWLYFSLQLPGETLAAGTDGTIKKPIYALRNALLMDVEPTQVNRIKQLWAPASPTLVFTASEPTRPLRVSDS